MGTARVYTDFQNLDDVNRLRLTSAGTFRDLERDGIDLHEGLRLSFYSDDANEAGEADEILAEGIVHYDEAARCWVGAIDWNVLRHASDERARGVVH